MHKKLILLPLIIFFLLSALPARAQLGQWKIGTSITNLQQAGQPTGLKQTDIFASINRVIAITLSIVGAIFLILALYASVLWLTAAGKEEQIEKAVKILKGSIIAIVIVFGAYTISYFVLTKIGGATPIEEQITGPGGSTAVSGDTQCTAKGGECVNAAANKNIPCDPNGTSDDPYQGSIIGDCGNNRVCCELKWSAGQGTEQGRQKCHIMQGQCLKELSGAGSCDKAVISGVCGGDKPSCISIGECDEPGPDSGNDCCIASR